MQSIIQTYAKRSDQIEAFYAKCLDKAMGRIRQTYEEEECTYMTLRLGEIAGFSPLTLCTISSRSCAWGLRELE
jgi:hypothetical protein